MDESRLGHLFRRFLDHWTVSDEPSTSHPIALEGAGAKHARRSLMRCSIPLTVLLASVAVAAQQAPLVLVQTIELPNVEGRIDHLAVDRDDQRLFVAALGNNSLEVVDLRGNTHLRSIKGLHEPQGITVVPTQKAVVVANGEGGDVQFRA